MKNFQLVNREYVPSVDLNVLGNTFNTLQQGHKETVQKASELKTYIAGLDMNEAEDNFKRQLLNEIETTIDNNTIYGNSYGALDDIITKAGDITSDDRIINRLKSQKAYKDYQAKVDKMNIPEGMKQMYKEENPYHYEDGPINEKTGKPIGGEIWKESTTPVTTIPEYEIQKYVLQIAAKEAGGGDSITFLDENGNPTSDPRKSFDGSMYKQVGTKFERLSEDKIKKAYNIAINSIPGAKDSLHQDYKYATWQYDKAVEKARQEGGDITPYVPGYTDKNGNVYSEEQWLNNKINGFADVAAYNHVYSNTSYGTALQNYRAAQARASQPANTFTNNTGGFGTFIAGTKEVEGNAFAGVENSLNAANKIGLDIVKKWMGGTYKNANSISDVIKDLINKKLATGPGSAANYFISKYGDRMSPEEKINISNAFMGYFNANQQKQQMIKAAGAEKDGLLFSADVASNNFTNNNKYSKAIINELNTIFKLNKKVPFEVGSDVMDEVKRLYGTDIAGLKKQGFDITKNADGNYDIIFTGENRNLLPKFSSIIRQADSNVTGSIGGWFKKKFTLSASSGNYYEGGFSGRTFGDTPFTKNTTDRLSSLYNEGIKAGSKAETKAGISKGMITFHGIDDGSFGALYYRENADRLGLDESKLQNIIERQNVQVDNMFGNGNFDSGIIEEIDEKGNAVKNIKDAQDIKTLIQKMYSDSSWKKDVTRSVMIPTGGGIGQPKGYILSFTIPKGAETGKYKEGDHVRFIVSGIAEEEINYDPSYNPSILANNIIQTSKATGSTIENIGYDNNLGDTRLIPINNQKYITSFMGKTKELNENEAESLSSYLITLQQLKGDYINGVYNDTQQHNIQFQNSIGSLSERIANIIDKPVNDVIIGVVNYLNDVDNYE